MRVLRIQPISFPEVIDIKGDLESLQTEVGGYIEALYPYEDPVAIICNEEGKINGDILNRALKDDQGKIYDIIAGTFLIVGLTEEDFGELSDDLLKKYKEMFQLPEIWI